MVDFSGYRIDFCQIWSLLEIAAVACQRKVADLVRSPRAAVLPRVRYGASSHCIPVYS